MLPTHEQTIIEARRCLANARDWLAAEWRVGASPTDDQAAAKREAMRLITQAKIELEKARR